MTFFGDAAPSGDRPSPLPSPTGVCGGRLSAPLAPLGEGGRWLRNLLGGVLFEVLLDFLEGEDGVGGGEDAVVFEPLFLAGPGAVGFLEGGEFVGQLGAPVVGLAPGVGEGGLVVDVQGAGHRVIVV